MVPDDATQALPQQDSENGVPLFLTLAFLAKPNTLDSATFLIAVLTAVKDAAANGQPITGQINGLGRTSADGDSDEFYALVESPDIEPLRAAIMDGVNSGQAAPEVTAPTDGNPVTPMVPSDLYLPKIPLGTLSAGADLPVQRIAPVAASFGVVTLVQDSTFVEVPIGSPTLNPDRTANASDPTSVIPPDSTAPAANPLDGATKVRKPPGIHRGSYVKVGSQQGRVDLVVTNGKVPGVDSDVEGSADNPAIRVVVYAESGGSWKATGKRIAARANSASTIAPLANRPASKKDLDVSALVGLQSDHEARADTEGWPEHARPDGDSIKSVFERGVSAWPGDTVTSLSAEQWGVARVKAFLSTAAGDRPDGYSRDDDLLPAGHPETKRITAVEPPSGDGRPDETKVYLDPAEVAARIAGLRSAAKV
jgi:hypothetical protein